MNFIEQFKVFWLLDTEHRFNGNETRLYFYLLKLSNSLYWKNPFTNADDYTASMVGVTVNTMKTARNRLKQANLINFKTGGNGARNKCTYWLISSEEIINKVSNNDTLSEESLTPYHQPNQQETDDINKQTLKENKNLKGANALPAGTQPGNGKDDSQKALKAEYQAMQKDARSLNDFIRDKKPAFIDPYVELWNLFAAKAGMPKVQALSDSRKKKFKIRVQEQQFDFRAILKKANESEMIRSGNWFTFDWILENQDNYLKTLEGKYDNKKAEQHCNGEQTSAATEELERRLQQKGKA